MTTKPKIREQMVKIETRHWTLRFWFSRRIVVGEPIMEDLAKIKNILDQSAFTSDTEKIADLIAEHLPEGAPVAAMEVLITTSGTGTVDYFEWP